MSATRIEKMKIVLLIIPLISGCAMAERLADDEWSMTCQSQCNERCECSTTVGQRKSDSGSDKELKLPAKP